MKFQTARALGRHLKEAYPDHLSPVYLVICKEEFDRKKLLKGILATLKKREGELSVFSASGEEGGLASVKKELYSPSLFGEKRAILFDEVKEEGAKALAAYLKRPSPDLYLLLGSSLPKLLEALYPLGKREIVALDLSKEKPWERRERKEQWLKAFAQARERELSFSLISFLFKEFGEDLSLLEQEVSKLIAFAKDKRLIGEEEARAVCSKGRPESLWKVAEGLVWERSPSALGAVSESGDLFVLIAQTRSELQLGLDLCERLKAKEDPRAALSSLFSKKREKIMRLLPTLSERDFRKGLLALFECELFAKNSSLPEGFLWNRFCLTQLSCDALPASQSAPS
ncbi:MAG TPA: hypothetical protein DCY54_06030 [Parachlamydiales bacterium]|nr:MAG: hypothetical protein A2Z85_01860 [Chlamydiae bacterium GWA2_50_15]OGN69521.1 MAG: hypothetical protein A3I15_02240 [Chlamydiae bacterium RIFCSPLOWO2_02_FULL_49_12]OGN71732.1 MAG: hypothetical protein A3G30_04065 [Chlamydiae bacterium RIFCSPLOWO2_12_FULL_49_12]HAZ16170.1 hypothetical protein [Parachlamydiales bacterium]HCJ83376.1 hypothetical protein [Parachlamydiales bacterium]